MRPLSWDGIHDSTHLCLPSAWRLVVTLPEHELTEVADQISLLGIWSPFSVVNVVLGVHVEPELVETLNIW